jgi:exopolysaccharide production protein ExoQ
MIPHLVLLVALAIFWWLIKRDTARREGISSAIWIPTLWVGIIASRNLSAWLGFGGGTDSLEGSPLDRLFFFTMIIAAFIVLCRRRLIWSSVIVDNWAVFLFYGYLLITVLWAEHPFVSFKRWFKEFGNILVVLVILTEEDPLEAFRAVFMRCAYVLLPLSVVFIRYFPSLGRYYNLHSGQMEAVGVTFQKNSLGCTVLVCGLVLIWDWFERTRPGASRQTRFDRYLPWGLAIIAVYLVNLCDSKTSIVCLILGATIMSASRLPVLRSRIRSLGSIVLAMAVGFFVLDSVFSLKEAVVSNLGRDMTFTGRTDVWRQLLDLRTDPVVGTGFCSFWSDQQYQSKLPPWLADGRSAHNGYLECYIDGGWVGVFFLSVMLIAAGSKINRQLPLGGDYVLIRLAVFVAIVVGDFSESHFGRMTPLGFLFLLAVIGSAGTARSRQQALQTVPDDLSCEPHGFQAAIS